MTHAISQHSNGPTTLMAVLMTVERSSNNQTLNQEFEVSESRKARESSEANTSNHDNQPPASVLLRAQEVE